ncbi:MAG: CpsD/CapB family tyrosine-protein kinase [Terriglobales bacterium]|jgi:capsular exopolysaccharide synthesis family protein
MSRIFEALRQSEMEVMAGLDSSAPVDPAPGQLTAPELSPAPEDPPAPAPAFAPALDLSQLTTITPQPLVPGVLVAMSDERGLGAEKFRVLATRLSNIRRNTPLKILQITSSVLGEGKTLVSSNLAVTLAKRSSQSVLLIEGDLRKPAVCPVFGLPFLEGVGDWWRQKDSSILPFLRRVKDSSLVLLGAGAVAHPVSILQSGRLTDLMRQLAGWFDWIIVDTPPLLPIADSNLWARLVDGTLMVIREGVVQRRSLKSAIDSMDSPKLVGVVINDAHDFDRIDYYGRYAYGYGTDQSTPPKKPKKDARK